MPKPTFPPDEVLLPLRPDVLRAVADSEERNPTVRMRRFVFNSGVVAEAQRRRSGKIVVRWLLPDGSQWTPETDMARFTDPEHPDYWNRDTK